MQTASKHESKIKKRREGKTTKQAFFQKKLSNQKQKNWETNYE